jgi:sugar phosphate isomerase/epimerase
MTPAFALSTMYAQHERFENGAEFASFAARLGYDAIEVSHSTPLSKVRQIAGSGRLPVASIHQPAPWEQSFLGMSNADLNLASLDRDEHEEAVHYARRSIELASELGARAVVLHLGHIANRQLVDMDGRLRLGASPEVFTRGALRRSAIELRSAVAEPYVARARAALVELARLAGRLGIVLGVESRLNFHEIPLPTELPVLLDGFDPLLVGYWHDVGHAEVLHRLGYVNREAWFANPSVRCVGAHVHDVRGLVDHRAPGSGDVDWDAHLSHLASLESWTLEINQFEPDEAVSGAPGLLARELSRVLTPG